MKLLKCNLCLDIFNLRTDFVKTCSCGKSSGQYESNAWDAWYSGPCEMIGFANESFFQALVLNVAIPPKEGDLGYKFDAFVIPDKAPTVRRKGLTARRR